MDAKECILTRRSIRKFTEEKIDRSTLEDVIYLASYAPTWKNSQTVRYIAVDDPDLKNALADHCALGFQLNMDTIKGCAAVVVLTTINGVAGYEKNGAFSTSKGAHWESFDAGIAAQTFCLAAKEYGLGTVIMGLFDEAETIRTLELKEGQSVSALIAVGYPAIDPPAPKRKEVSDLLSYK